MQSRLQSRIDDELGKKVGGANHFDAYFVEITDGMKHDVQSQLVERRQHEKGRGLDRASVGKTALREFDHLEFLDGRLMVAPGKSVLKRLNTLLKDRHDVQVTPKRLVLQFEPAEIPSEMRTILRRLEAFAAAPVPKP